MKVDSFKKHMTAETLMGPNNLRILEEMFSRYPMNLSTDDLVLDLGCGKGLTSFAAACETAAKVYACDLWISAEDNQKRFSQWGVSERVVPFHTDANELQFEKNLFRAMISVDAYHYFATEKDFFAEKILPFLKDGAEVWIGVPGIKTEFSGRSEELLSEWLGDEAYMFRSPTEWERIIGWNDRMKEMETWEMECFELAWQEWLATGQKFALGDKPFFENIIRPYTCFVGIHIKLK